MSNVMKLNTSNKIGFSAKDAYGADFKISIFDMATNTVIVDKATMTEGVEPIVAASTTTDGVQTKGANNIIVLDASVFSPADRVSIGTEIYRISSIDVATNTITLHKGLVEEVAAGISVDRVGNLSVFYVELFVTTLGFFLIQARDTKFGLQHTESVEVKTYLVDDRLDQLADDVDTVAEDVKANTSFRIVI